MVSPKEELLNVLDDLKDDEFKKFKWLLKLDNERSFAAAKLEKADRQDTVDIMTETYGSIDDAVKETMKVLKKNNRNDLVKSLEGLYGKRGEDGHNQAKLKQI